jgi:mandelate racemase
MSNHLYPEICAHLLRVTPTAHWLEFVDWASPVLAEPLEPRNGALTASNKPGIGLSWDERAVTKYSVAI